MPTIFLVREAGKEPGGDHAREGGRRENVPRFRIQETTDKQGRQQRQTGELGR